MPDRIGSRRLDVPEPTEFEVQKRRSIALLRRNISAIIIARETGAFMQNLNRWRSEILAASPHLRRKPVNLPKPKRYSSGRIYWNLPDDVRPTVWGLYADGLSDTDIAKQSGFPRERIVSWRGYYHLTANFPRGMKLGKARKKPVAKPAITPMSNPIYAAMKQAVGRGIAADIADDAISELWLAMAEGRISADDIAAHAKRFRNRAVADFASSYGPVSLNEAIKGTDDLLLIDTLQDESSSDWLEEMGATVW